MTFYNSGRPGRGTRIAAALLLAAVAAAPAAAQEAAAPAPAAAAPAAAPDPNAVVATVDGAAITEADVAAALDQYAQPLQQFPEEVRRDVIINVLTDMQVIAAAAEAAGLDQSQDFANRLKIARLELLREFYVRQIEGTVTDEMVRAAYDEQVAAFQSQEERRVSHILVMTQEEAQAIIDQLNMGGDFAMLAMQHSIDGSAAQGGDLGYIARGDTIPAFEDVAFALEPGAYTMMPVESQFGFHVIEVTDVRQSQPPAFEDLAAQLRDTLMNDAYNAEMDRLRNAAAIDVLVPNAADAAGQTAPAAAAPAPADGAAAPAAPADTGAAPAPAPAPAG